MDSQSSFRFSVYFDVDVLLRLQLSQHPLACTVTETSSQVVVGTLFCEPVVAENVTIPRPLKRALVCVKQQDAPKKPKVAMHPSFISKLSLTDNVTLTTN